MNTRNVNHLCRFSNDKCKHWNNGKCNWLHKYNGSLTHINPDCKNINSQFYYKIMKDVHNYLEDENNLKYILMSMYDNYDEYFNILDEDKIKFIKEIFLHELLIKCNKQTN